MLSNGLHNIYYYYLQENNPETEAFICGPTFKKGRITSIIKVNGKIWRHTVDIPLSVAPAPVSSTCDPPVRELEATTPGEHG